MSITFELYSYPLPFLDSLPSWPSSSSGYSPFTLVSFSVWNVMHSIGAVSRSRGERCLQEHEPLPVEENSLPANINHLLPSRRGGALRVPSYLRTGCWWAWRWSCAGHQSCCELELDMPVSFLETAFHSNFLFLQLLPLPLLDGPWPSKGMTNMSYLWIGGQHSLILSSWISREPLIVLLPKVKRIFFDQIRNSNPYT